MNMILVWLIAAAVFFVVELATVSFCSLWFTAGSLCAIPAAALGAPVWLQIIIFAVVSGACFLLVYPKLKKKIKSGRSATNADRLLGEICVVTADIDNLAGKGTVIINSQTWSARSDSGDSIQSDTRVRILRIEGAKLIVTPVAE